MSTQYKKPSEVPTDTLIKRVENLADAVTKGESGKDDFTMRIPAECDRDADIVLAEVARRFKGLEQQLVKSNEDYKTLFCAFESCQDELKNANERVAELEQFHETVAYRCFLAGLTTEKPREPNVQNNTATAISHFNVMVDRHARSASRHILEQLRKELE